MTGSGAKMRGAVPVRKHPTLLQVFLQAGEEGLGVGPFKKEGKGLKPQRGCFPSWTPEGARALRGLKDRAWEGYGGAGGPRRGQGPRKSVSGSEAAAVTSLCHRLRLLGGWGGGGRGEARMGERGGAATPGCGGQRGKRGERLLKDLKPGRSGAQRPPAPPRPAPPPHPAPGAASGCRPAGTRPHLPPPPPQPPLLERGTGAEKAGLGALRGRRPCAEGKRRAPQPRRLGAAGERAALSPPACVSPGPRGPPTPHSPSGCSLRAGVGRKEREVGLDLLELGERPTSPRPQPSRQRHSLLIFLLLGVRHPV